MTPNRLRRSVALASLLCIAACGGGDDDATTSVDDATLDTAPVDTPSVDTAAADATVVSGGGTDRDEPDPGRESDASESSESSESSEANSTGAETTGRACGLLDEELLAETFAGQQGTFGDPYDFGAGLASPDGSVCTWTDGSTGLSLRLTLEDAATAETDDHSGRAYNIDVEPVVEPQDGPGEKAVLLLDQAFSDVGGDDFPYGFFFVDGDVAVFIESVGIDLGAENLRTLADEAAARHAGPATSATATSESVAAASTVSVGDDLD